ncbi:unnamed protein product [Arctia plantaginis]|uniref:Uncharacterized protein n=1 Tax=Arctia plantaginis TaxID=874455 RepID=A0A8S0YPW2_ARCPL|nr:unnamed protein product [Arctia plantaginis]CAB3244628.1 unnamed protein product [Arctia plantaginis]
MVAVDLDWRKGKEKSGLMICDTNTCDSRKNPIRSDTTTRHSAVKLLCTTWYYLRSRIEINRQEILTKVGRK